MATTFTNVATLSYNGQEVRSNTAVGQMESSLSMTKYAIAETYSAGDTVTYVVSIVNSSPTALSGLTVSDDLGAYPFGTGTVQPLSYVEGSLQYYQNGVLQPDPAVATTNGLVLSDIAVPAGGNTTLIYAAAVNEFAPLSAGATVTNTVTVTGSVEAQAEETVTAVSGALISVVKSISPNPVTDNGTVTYTMQLYNTGNAALTADDDAVISDTFDPILSDITVALDGAPLSAGTGYTYTEATSAFATTAGVITVPAAAYIQDPTSGAWTVTPGSATLTVTGTIGA